MIDHPPCQERDRLVLAFVLAVNAQNNASSSLEGALNEAERYNILTSMKARRDHSRELRDLLLLHCEKHGC
jgi:hypothetical protein